MRSAKLTLEKNRIWVILAMALIIATGFWMSHPDSAFAGEGTRTDPYLIEDLDDLKWVRDEVAAGRSFSGEYIKLTGDIVLPEQWEPIGKLKEGTNDPANGVNVHPFSGTLDGGGHTVTSAEGGQPLFGYVREATIRDLSIAGKRIEGCGLIANYVVDRGASGKDSAKTATIVNVTILSGTSIAGSGFISGYASVGNTVDIIDCTVEEGVVIGCHKDQSWVGSFAGNYNGVITGCHSAATVYGVDYVGGIIGAKSNSMSETSVSNCVFTGQVVASGSFAGGIAGGGYGGINWGILSAPNAPMLNVINCLCTGSVRASDTAGGIVGYETSLQVWDNGIGYLQSNLFAGTVETAGGTQVGAITGAFRGLDRYDIIQDNYYGEGCGAARGIGGVEYVDTSCETHETEIGVNYFDTSKEVPIFEGVNDIFKGNLRADHNRTDDPLGADAETLAKRITQEQLQDGTAAALMNAAEGSLGNWVQNGTCPVPQRVKTIVALYVQEGYRTQYDIGEELDLSDLKFDLVWSDGSTETIPGDDKDLRITGFDSSERAVITVTAVYGTIRTQFPVRILKQDTGETISVYFTLMGDRAHGPDADCGVHTRLAGNLEEWVPSKKYEVPVNCTAGALIRQALSDAGLGLAGNANSVYGSLYISGIQIPGTDQFLYEKDNGENSGWMYAVNDTEPGVGVDLYFLEDGDELLLFFTDDYKQENSAMPYQEEEDRIQAKIVIDLINALPAAADITISDESSVASARAAYQKLTVAQQALVDPSFLKHLVDAEAAIEALKGGGEDPDKVVAGKKYTVSGNTYKVTKVASAKAGQVTLVKAGNKKTVTIPKSVKLADGKAYKVTRLAAGSFKGKRIRTVVLKTKLSSKAFVKGSLKGSKVKTIKVKVGTRAQNKSYVKKYKRFFTKANAGRKVTVR